MADTEHQTSPQDHLNPKLIEARRREMAMEHLVALRHAELLDDLDGSLDHLWDPVVGEARNDEAVRNIARRMLKSLRAES